MAGVKVRINRRSIALTISPIRQSQTTKTSTMAVETKIISLEAVIFMFETIMIFSSKPGSHVMTLFSGRW